MPTVIATRPPAPPSPPAPAPALPGAAAIGAVHSIPISLIDLGPNPRPVSGDLSDLCASISATGQLSEITVARVGQRYELFDGERRLRAIARLGGARINALVAPRLEGPDRTLALLAVHAHELSYDPITEAEIIHRLFSVDKLSIPLIARQTGCSPAWLKGRLSLLLLTEARREAIRSGEMPLAHALELVRLTRANRDNRLPPRLRTVARTFTRSHRLAQQAARHCLDAGHDHPSRGPTFSCGPSWEHAIRADERQQLSTPQPARPSLTDSLTEFDLTVFRLLAAGHSMPEVATRLDTNVRQLNRRTITPVLRRLRLSSADAVLSCLILSGLIDPPYRGDRPVVSDAARPVLALMLEPISRVAIAAKLRIKRHSLNDQLSSLADVNGIPATRRAITLWAVHHRIIDTTAHFAHLDLA